MGECVYLIYVSHYESCEVMHVFKDKTEACVCGEKIAYDLAQQENGVCDFLNDAHALIVDKKFGEVLYEVMVVERKVE